MLFRSSTLTFAPTFMKKVRKLLYFYLLFVLPLSVLLLKGFSYTFTEENTDTVLSPYESERFVHQQAAAVESVSPHPSVITIHFSFVCVTHANYQSTSELIGTVSQAEIEHQIDEIKQLAPAALAKTHHLRCPNNGCAVFGPFFLNWLTITVAPNSYLNCLHHKEYDGAIEHLHSYFDLCMQVSMSIILVLLCYFVKVREQKKLTFGGLRLFLSHSAVDYLMD